MVAVSPAIKAIAQRFESREVQALALVGSYARGDAGPYSDIDVLRFVNETDKDLPGSGTHLLDGHLVNVSNVTSDDIEAWFSRPEEAVNIVVGLRTALPIVDPDGTFAGVQARAHQFVWNAEMQQRANVWASKSMIGWIEEVHKGLEGLRRHDIGRMLNAQFGLSWGLSRVMQVQRGVLIAGDNSVFDEIEAEVGVDSEWATLQRIVFGVTTSSLEAKVQAGLRLYALTAVVLADVWQPQDASLIAATASRINSALNNS